MWIKTIVMLRVLHDTLNIVQDFVLVWTNRTVCQMPSIQICDERFELNEIKFILKFEFEQALENDVFSSAKIRELLGPRFLLLVGTISYLNQSLSLTDLALDLVANNLAASRRRQVGQMSADNTFPLIIKFVKFASSSHSRDEGSLLCWLSKFFLRLTCFGHPSFGFSGPNSVANQKRISALKPKRCGSDLWGKVFNP